MSFDVNVYHHVTITDPKLEALMSALSDAIAALSAKVDAATTRVTTDVAALKQQIADLEAKVAAGTATPEDLAALADAGVRLDKIDPATESTLP